MQPEKTELQEIREHLRYSFQDMADELKLEKATYQGYDTGRRPTPDEVITAARCAKIRVDSFMAGLPARIDEYQPHGCPNAAVKGAW